MQSKKDYPYILICTFFTITLLLMVLLVEMGCSGLIFEFNLDLTEIVSLSLVFLLDKLSLTLVSVVALISSVVLLYSSYYMSSSKGFNKFMMILLWFIISMWVLCLSSNLFMVMLGWDMLGMSSFCLIIFYQNWKSYSSSMITFVSNRLGDLLLLISISMLWSLSSLSSYALVKHSLVISLVFIMGALSKSAQMPFSAWLPEAMAAPTPVSSLVHSSTLVTAGVYLLMRFPWIWSGTESLLMVIAVATATFAGILACLEMDLKKLIAYSTLSHMSIMVLFLSIGSSESALLHLVMHATFKSSIFMLAGIIIHSSEDTQDSRALVLPVGSSGLLWAMLMLSTLSMVGAPFLSGFYSKEFMMMMLVSSSEGTVLKLFSMLCAISLTAAYSARLLTLMNLKLKTQMLNLSYSASGNSMLSGLTVSFFLSMVLGGMLVWVTIPYNYWELNSSSSVSGKLLIQFALLLGILLGLNSNFTFTKNSMLIKTFNSAWMLPMLMKKISFVFLNSVLFKVGESMSLSGVIDWVSTQSYSMVVKVTTNSISFAEISSMMSPKLWIIILVVMAMLVT